MDWQALMDEDWVWYFLMPGIAAAILALAAWRADRRRIGRSNPDAVGWLPWRDIAFWATLAALLLLGAALRGYLSGDPI
ncbi:hypothetical protein B0I00_0223 [Novosphingobium kunmingense]|uniref:Uncharacterized protein n=1 Tax=Novosphingobium kunmingense TaxID=1211806 RepID=A0A2N0I1H7_9SPHN|nr:hypothetical protein [Novosphingobium kunmingense]PKB25042.1 hypothetical protein B0I00_0223 [Novosphingobium kunmingense]